MGQLEKLSGNQALKTAVIIVTYNAMPWAKKCFDSIQNSDIPLEVYIQDNGSTDRTQDLIEKEYPHFHFNQSPENLGFGQGNNKAIERAYHDGAEYFFLLNQDAYIFPDTISVLLEAVQSNNNYGILSPVHYSGDGSTLDFGFQNYIKRNKLNSSLLSDLFNTSCDLKSIYPIDFINAAAWFIPKSTISEIGGFNPLFFHYGEDRDYIARCIAQGKRVGIVPSSKVIHDREQNPKPKQREHSNISNLIHQFLDSDKMSIMNLKKQEIKNTLAYLLQFQFKKVGNNLKRINFLFKNAKKLDKHKEIIQKESHPFLKIKEA